MISKVNMFHLDISLIQTPTLGAEWLVFSPKTNTSSIT